MKVNLEIDLTEGQLRGLRHAAKLMYERGGDVTPTLRIESFLGHVLNAALATLEENEVSAYGAYGVNTWKHADPATQQTIGQMLGLHDRTYGFFV